MRGKEPKKALALMGIIFVTVVFFSTEAFSWGWAVHTYVDDHLGKKRGMKNLDEIYGGMAVDTFNYMFDRPDYLMFLSDQTHHEFMKTWNKADHGRQKSLALGFVSHNDVWGADSTAHHSGRTFGQEQGYVIAKAEILKPVIAGLLADLLGLPPSEALNLIALEVAHELVENGVDILMKTVDPVIGEKITAAALLRSPEFPLLLVRAYGKDFARAFGIDHLEGAGIIISAEKEFRESMILYGQVLMLDETTALHLISEQTAGVARGFLSANGIELPPDLDIVPLIEFLTAQAMDLCAGDFSLEVDATATYVNRQLKEHGISY
jgi:hypothetical protein